MYAVAIHNNLYVVVLNLYICPHFGHTLNIRPKCILSVELLLARLDFHFLVILVEKHIYFYLLQRSPNEP